MHVNLLSASLLAQQPAPTTTRPRKPQLDAQRIACVYENQPLSQDSTYAVARLLSQLASWLAQVSPETQVVAVGPSDSRVEGVRNLAVEPGRLTRFRSRAMHSRWATALRIPRRAESSIPYQRARTAMQMLARESGQPEIVICSTFNSVILARQFLPQARIIYWIQSMPRMGQERQALESVNAADAVVSPTRALYTDLFRLFCQNQFRAPVWIVPNSVDGQQFSHVHPATRSKARAELGLVEDELAVIHVGRSPEKGLQIAESALSICNLGNRRVSLLSVGGQHHARRTIGHGVEVRELGRIPPQQLNRVYQASDLGIVPSVWWENCPLALLEMMAIGLCPIGSRVGGIPEIIEHNRNGLLVDRPNDVEAWASALETALLDDDLRSRFGQQARESVGEKFSPDRFVTRWIHLINAITRTAVCT